jgi:peroxiredoxin
MRFRLPFAILGWSAVWAFCGHSLRAQTYSTASPAVPAAAEAATMPAEPAAQAVAEGAPGDSIFPYQFGDLVEDFRLQGTDGRYYSLSDYPDAKGFVVVFTCNNCPCAGDYQQRLVWMGRKLPAEGYPLLAINANKFDRQFGESLQDMAARADSAGFNFPYLIDESQAVAKRYGATKTPEAFLLVRDPDLDWGFRLIYSGAIDDKPADQYRVKNFYLGQAIAMHEQGMRPPVPRNEPMGCTIEGIGSLGKSCPMEALEKRVRDALED